MMPSNPKRAHRRTSAGSKRARKQARRAGAESPSSDPGARAAFFESAPPYAPYVVVEAHGGRFVVATSDLHLGKGLFTKQTRPEFRVLRRAVTVVEILTGDDSIAGRIFVDVGANIGTSTVWALISHGFGSAICCEPEEQNYRLLRANLALNGLEEHARPLRVAVSNRVGRSELVVHEESGAFHWVAVDPETVRTRKQLVRGSPPKIHLPCFPR